MKKISMKRRKAPRDDEMNIAHVKDDGDITEEYLSKLFLKV